MARDLEQQQDAARRQQRPQPLRRGRHVRGGVQHVGRNHEVEGARLEALARRISGDIEDRRGQARMPPELLARPFEKER